MFRSFLVTAALDAEKCQNINAVSVSDSLAFISRCCFSLPLDVYARMDVRVAVEARHIHGMVSSYSPPRSTSTISSPPHQPIHPPPSLTRLVGSSRTNPLPTGEPSAHARLPSRNPHFPSFPSQLPSIALRTATAIPPRASCSLQATTTPHTYRLVPPPPPR